MTNKKLAQSYHKDQALTKGLKSAHLGLALANILFANPHPVLLITPDVATTNRLEREIKFFLGNAKNSLHFLNFPGWETLPYDHFSPHEDVVSERLLALYQMINHFRSGVVFVTVSDLMSRLPPKEYVDKNSLILSVGQELDLERLRVQFITRGYTQVTKVMERGEFAVRGSIIDVFPMGNKNPFRIDLFDTEIDSIRIFDVDTQRSLESVDNIRVLPAKEFPLDEEGVERFRSAWRSYFDGNPLRSSVYQSVSDQKPCPGLEYYLPLFFASTATLFDYLPSNSSVVAVGDFEQYFCDFWSELNNRYEQLAHDQDRPIMRPKDLFMDHGELDSKIDAFRQILPANAAKEKDNQTLLSICFKVIKDVSYLSKEHFKQGVLDLPKFLQSFPNAKLLLVAETPGRSELLLQKLRDIELLPKFIESWQEFLNNSDRFAITIANLERPLHMVLKGSEQEIILITETQIFGEHVIESFQPTSTKKLDSIISNLNELQVGEAVVHVDYGVGRYLGLQKINTDGVENEFLVLEYAKSAKLYVPVTSLSLVGRYTGVESSQVSLNQLGSKQWDKAKRKAMEQVRDTAVELLEVYAKRKNSQGFAFNTPEFDYAKFVSDFPYIVTVDQDRAINEVVSDMLQKLPMDRLVCGDVGFGKTEVAMRAAFIAVNNSKQVAILTPTTLLAQQHFNDFQDRFAGWPVKIALLSRFNKAKELEKTKDGLAEGKIDIVIGTHKLIQKDIKFKNLGLLVVDEEHRFGVRQKEAIKKLALNVDILSLTATPIPRTLNMAFAGIRDFSIISTPPAKRLAIKTFISEHNPYLVKEAILRETARGGQVYFLHNNINSIDKIARELRDLAPGVKIAVAHGQMRKNDLEKIMNDFYHQRIDLLICTTIIESGIDVPNANTIVINRADRFGLAQLHQLRGRVGRSHHQAYAYLIIPPKSLLTKDAEKRLEAIAMMRDLGAGFALATSDLEIRGAGELLGEKQSGIMQEIGFDLYMGMLKRAFKNLKKGKTAIDLNPEDAKSELELGVAALIPDKYIDSVNLRLVLYKRIADAEDQKVLDELQVEMIDRFGILPEQVKNLFRISSLKLIAEKLNITKMSLGANKGKIEFKPDLEIDLKQLIELLRKHTTQFKFSDSNGIEFEYDSGSNSRLEFIENLFDEWANL